MTKRHITPVIVILLFITASLTFAQQVLPLIVKPVNLSPADGATINTTVPFLEWTGEADTYKVTVKNALGEKVFTAGGTQIELCELEGETLVCTADPAAFDLNLPNGLLTWRVKAKSGDEIAKSDATSFTVNFPGSPVLTSPTDSDTVNSSPLLTWIKLSVSNVEYKVKIKNTQSDAKFNTDWILADDLCTDESCAYETDLGFGPYKWSVLARRELTSGIFTSKSEKRTFTYEPPVSE